MKIFLSSFFHQDLKVPPIAGSVAPEGYNKSAHAQ